MKLDNVILEFQVEDSNSIPKINQALKELDITLSTDFSQVTEHYRRNKSVVRISYGDNSIVHKNTKGRVVLIRPQFRQETTAPVVIKGLDQLKNYQINYDSGAINIFREDEKPIRYHISK